MPPGGKQVAGGMLGESRAWRANGARPSTRCGRRPPGHPSGQAKPEKHLPEKAAGLTRIVSSSARPCTARSSASSSCRSCSLSAPPAGAGRWQRGGWGLLAEGYGGRGRAAGTAGPRLPCLRLHRSARHFARHGRHASSSPCIPRPSALTCAQLQRALDGGPRLAVGVDASVKQRHARIYLAAGRRCVHLHGAVQLRLQLLFGLKRSRAGAGGGSGACCQTQRSKESVLQVMMVRARRQRRPAAAARHHARALCWGLPPGSRALQPAHLRRVQRHADLVVADLRGTGRRGMFASMGSEARCTMMCRPACAKPPPCIADWRLRMSGAACPPHPVAPRSSRHSTPGWTWLPPAPPWPAPPGWQAWTAQGGSAAEGQR